MSTQAGLRHLQACSPSTSAQDLRRMCRMRCYNTASKSRSQAAGPSSTAARNICTSRKVSSPARRIARDTNSMRQAISLYHQTSTFPNLSPPASQIPPTSTAFNVISQVTRISLPIDEYIQHRLRHRTTPRVETKNPFQLDTRRAMKQHDPLDDQENVEIGTLYGTMPSKERVKPWNALQTVSTPEERRKGLKIIDALFGTVDGRSTGLEMVRDVSTGIAAKQSAQTESIRGESSS